MNNQNKHWPDAEDGIRPDPKSKILYKIRQSLMISVGFLILLYALYNILADLNILNKEDIQNWGKQLISTVTPSVDQLRPIRVNLQNDGTPVVENAVVSPEEATEQPESTPIFMSPEEAGFLPFQIEQTQSQSEPVEPQDVVLVVPQRLIIPAINLDAPVIEAEKESITTEGVVYEQWLAPDLFSAGWHTDSAGLGQIGNMVFNGHHNINGEVFKDLEKLQVGDRISVYGEDSQRYGYIVTNVLILPERDVTLEERLENARWILPSTDQRLTMVTCWPYYSNTHRLIIVARPLETGSFQPLFDQ